MIFNGCSLIEFLMDVGDRSNHFFYIACDLQRKIVDILKLIVPRSDNNRRNLLVQGLKIKILNYSDHGRIHLSFTRPDSNGRPYWFGKSQCPYSRFIKKDVGGIVTAVRRKVPAVL